MGSYRQIDDILVLAGIGNPCDINTFFLARYIPIRKIPILLCQLVNITGNSFRLFVLSKLFRMICCFVKILPDAVSNVFLYHNDFSKILDLIIHICSICLFRPDKAISVYLIDSCSIRRIACHKILVFA